jgi:hypothetical protein
MSDTPMDVAYNPIVTDPEPASPSSNINPSVGMKKPQYGYSYGRTVGGGIHDKRVVDIWTVKADAPMPENPIMPTQTYEGCECETCAENNTTCAQCQDCGGMDAETEMAMYDASIGKADPCWDGYVQRGMKPGDNGQPVPNCVPVAKLDEMFSNFGKDYTRSTTNNYRVEE